MRWKQSSKTIKTPTLIKINSMLYHSMQPETTWMECRPSEISPAQYPRHPDGSEFTLPVTSVVGPVGAVGAAVGAGASQTQLDAEERYEEMGWTWVNHWTWKNHKNATTGKMSCRQIPMSIGQNEAFAIHCGAEDGWNMGKWEDGINWS